VPPVVAQYGLGDHSDSFLNEAPSPTTRLPCDENPIWPLRGGSCGCPTVYGQKQEFQLSLVPDHFTPRPLVTENAERLYAADVQM